MRERKNMKYSTKRKLAGFFFILPWFIGFGMFFVKPIIEGVYFSFTQTKVGNHGVEKYFVGIKNYKDAFLTDEHFNRYFVESLSDTVVSTAIILILSIFLAVVLNTKFPFRIVARTVFFLPVLITSGAITRVLSLESAMAVETGSMADVGELFLQSSKIKLLLINSHLPMWLLNTIFTVITDIITLISYSGVQILLALAALQNVPKSLYEAADIDGATAYEKFWKITFPRLLPIMPLIALFTLVETFNRSKINGYIEDIAFHYSNYGLSSAMGMVYLIAVILIVILIIKLTWKGAESHE